MGMGACQVHLHHLDREVYLGGGDGGDHVKMDAGMHVDESEGRELGSECGSRNHARAAWEDHDRVMFSKGQMLAVAEGMFSFELRVDHFAVSLAVSRDVRT